jgi:hypothetical protein
MTFSPSLIDELRAIISGLLGGVRYGVKIRFPHALIMTFLFRRNLSTRDKLQTVIKLVGEHAANLASFATIYKSILLVLKLLSRKLRTIPKDTHASVWRVVGRIILDTIGKQQFTQKENNRILCLHSPFAICLQ